MFFEYCPKCGMKLDKKEIGDEGLVPFCLVCEQPHFSFSYPCVICLVVDDANNIVLIKQSYVSNNYICVAGFVKQGETIEHTALREVEEETGLKVLDVEYIKSYYYSKRDNLMFGFVCKVEKAEFSISNEIDKAEWFTLEEAEGLLRKGSIGQVLLRDYIGNMENKR